MQDSPATAGFRQGYVLPDIAATEAPIFMAALAAAMDDASVTGLRFSIDRDSRRAVPFLPHWNAPPHAPQTRVLAMRETIGKILASRLDRHEDLSRRQPRSQEMTGMIDPVAGLVFGVLLAGEPGARDTLGRPKLAAFVGDIDETAAPVAAVMRRGRYAKLSVYTGVTGQNLALVFLEDDSALGATIDGLRAGHGKGLSILAPIETSAGVVWLPDELGLPKDRRESVAAMLKGLIGAGAMAEGQALAVMQEPSGDILWAVITDADDQPMVPLVITDHVSENALRIDRLEVLASDTARKALQTRILEARFPVGYRTSLQPVPEGAGVERDVEILCEEIAEREAEIELIRALSAPQMRLLRFSDAQLPALVDGLRRLPPEMFRSADLRYAAAHSAGRAEPAHFVLYDPARVAIDGYLPEHAWRGKTEDRPIRYWLDPHAAQAMDRDGARLLVFTPARHMLVPAIDSFGGRLADTLRLILGNLFAEASVVLDAPGAEPVFVFSPPDQSGADMDVELLDWRWFEPITLSLRWINDYMMVRTPRQVDREVLARLAEDLYEGEVAAALTREADATKADLLRQWQDSEVSLQAQIDAVVRHVAQEIDRTAERMRLGHAYLSQTRDRMAKLDTLIETMRGRIAASAAGVAELNGLAGDLSGDRFDMVSDLLTEIEVGDRAVAEAEARVDAQRARLEELIDRLRHR